MVLRVDALYYCMHCHADHGATTSAAGTLLAVLYLTPAMHICMR